MQPKILSSNYFRNLLMDKGCIVYISSRQLIGDEMNIRVNCISPAPLILHYFIKLLMYVGLTSTKKEDVYRDLDKIQRHREEWQTRRNANAVAFLLSDENSFMTAAL